MVDLSIIKRRVEKVPETGPDFTGTDYYYVHIVLKTSFTPPLDFFSRRFRSQGKYYVDKIEYLITLDSSVNLN